MSLLLLLAALAYAGAYIFNSYHDRSRKIAYSVHIQGKTESDEAMDFTVILFEGESEGVWKEKLSQAFLLKEWRLKYQNERMQEIEKNLRKQLDDAKKAK